MKRNTLLAAMAVTATVLGGAAYADANHGHGNKSGERSEAGMMQGEGSGMMGGMGDMMGMMQRMHGMMGGGQMGGQMGGGQMGGMMGGADMGGGMMQMFDANGDGTVTPEELRTQLQAKLTEFDGNGDGSLSIAEFEKLHSAMIRETMVDRFQMLDADGDGAVTADEMMAPAKKMERMQMMRSNMGQPAGQPGTGQGMGQGMDMGQGQGQGQGMGMGMGMDNGAKKKDK